MKQIELQLKERLLIVEFEDLQYLENVISCHNTGIRFMSDKEEPIKLLCKGSEITENILKSLIEPKRISSSEGEIFPDYKNKGWLYGKPNRIKSFISGIEARGFYWKDNPVEEPIMEKYGWYASGSPFEDSGWMYKEVEDEYYKVLKAFEEAESRTFNPEKTLIFKIID